MSKSDRHFLSDFKIAAVVIGVNMRQFGKLEAERKAMGTIWQATAPPGILDAMRTAFGG